MDDDDDDLDGDDDSSTEWNLRMIYIFAWCLLMA